MCPSIAAKSKQASRRTFLPAPSAQWLDFWNFSSPRLHLLHFRLVRLALHLSLVCLSHSLLSLPSRPTLLSWPATDSAPSPPQSPALCPDEATSIERRRADASLCRPSLAFPSRTAVLTIAFFLEVAGRRYQPLLLVFAQRRPRQIVLARSLASLGTGAALFAPFLPHDEHISKTRPTKSPRIPPLP